ncbi:MAG: EamA family transporter [Candidatus Nanopelagicales bacterium]
MTAVLALLSSLLWGSADFLGGLNSKRLPSLLVVALSQTAGLIAVTLVALVVGAWHAPTGYLPWAVLASLSGASGLVVFYKALATGSMGVVAPISGLSGLVPLAAGLLAGESFSTYQALGALAIGAGVVLASGPELKADTGWKPLALAVLAALLFGISMLAIARGSEYSALMTMTGMRVVSVSIVGLAALIGYRRGAFGRPNLRPYLPAIIALGILDVGANVAFGMAADEGPLVVASVLGSLYPVVTAVLAATFLHERLRLIQYAGVAAAIAGLMVVTAA